MGHTFGFGDQSFEVSIAEKEGGYIAKVDGREYALRDVVVDGDAVTFAIANRVLCLPVSRDRQGIHVHHEGRNYVLAAAQADDEGTAGHHHGGDGSVVAPMPGSIVRINVAVGDAVASGASLVVIESMKMQNDITSPVNGVVAAINCKTGDQVGFGDVLVEVEAG